MNRTPESPTPEDDSMDVDYRAMWMTAELARERAEERATQLETALRLAQGQMLGLSSTLHYDDMTQASLMEWAEEMPVPLPEFWRGYIYKVRAKKGTSADILTRAAARAGIDLSPESRQTLPQSEER